MRKKVIILLFLILIKILLPINPYIELNHLNIIHKIKVTCKNQYQIEYYEILPQKEDNGIKYEYKKYHVESKDLIKGLQKIENKKNIYKKKAKIIIKNCKNKKEIKDKIKRG